MLTFNDVPEALSQILQKLTDIEALLKQKESEPKIDENERITISELSAQYKISKPTIHNLMKTDKIIFEKIGRKTLFRRIDVENYFKSKRK